MGKSSLIAALKKSDEQAPYSWLQGDSLSYTRSISYYPWRQILRQAIDAHDDDSPGEVRRKLSYNCTCCSLPGGDIPFLEALLAVESEESAKVVMGYQGEALTQKMIDATRGFLCGLARESSLVIVFDDLHWAGCGSVNLLHYLSKRLRDSQVLILGAYRPQEVALDRGTAGFVRERHPLEQVQLEMQREFGEFEVNLDRASGEDFIDAFVDAAAGEVQEPAQGRHRQSAQDSE